MTQAAKTVEPLETLTVEEPVVGCDGAGKGANLTPALGHPLVYLTVGAHGVDCPYCGRRYMPAAGARRHAH